MSENSGCFMMFVVPSRTRAAIVLLGIQVAGPQVDDAFQQHVEGGLVLGHQGHEPGADVPQVEPRELLDQGSDRPRSRSFCAYSSSTSIIRWLTTPERSTNTHRTRFPWSLTNSMCFSTASRMGGGW